MNNGESLACSPILYRLTWSCPAHRQASLLRGCSWWGLDPGNPGIEMCADRHRRVAVL